MNANFKQAGKQFTSHALTLQIVKTKSVIAAITTAPKAFCHSPSPNIGTTVYARKTYSASNGATANGLFAIKPIPDAPIHAVEIETENRDVPVLGELLAAMDLPPQALSSYENLETGVGTTYVLCDTAAEETAARAQVEALLAQWSNLLSSPVRAIRDRVIKREDWSDRKSVV